MYFLSRSSKFHVNLSGWMTKRSQLKSRFSFTNYKERWFVLTRSSLAYFDSSDQNRKRERGRILLKDIRVVEKVVLREPRDRDEPNRPHAFQIGYREGRGASSSSLGQRTPQEFFLCILAKSDIERDEWIALMRNLVRTNANLAEKYHPSLWATGRWPCCGETTKGANAGCEPITWTPRQTKSDPAPPLPMSIVQSSAIGGGSFDDFESLSNSGTQKAIPCLGVPLTNFNISPRSGPEPKYHNHYG